MSLLDAHVHLQDLELEPHLADVLARAREAGVNRMICNGTREGDWAAVSRLAQEHPGIFPCFGLHPWHVDHRSKDWLAHLRTFLEQRPSGVGEIGVDRWIETRDEAAQAEVFCAQLALACELDRPVMIHCLHAWPWLMELLRGSPIPARGMLLHAFGGPLELIQPLAHLGAWFSFAADVLSETRLRKREALCHVPLDRLLIETDTPDILPPPEARARELPGTRRKYLNEPANLPLIRDGIAAILDMTPAALDAQLASNAQRWLAQCGA